MAAIETVGNLRVLRNFRRSVPDAVKLARDFHTESKQEFQFIDNRVGKFIHSVLDARGLLLVAYDKDDKAVAFVASAIVGNPITGRVTAEELTLYVAPEHRGGRIGVYLASEFEKHGREAGATMFRVTVQKTVEHDRTVRFFERIGYVWQETSMMKGV